MTTALVVGALVYFGSELFLHRHYIFDDAFISYRYAKNLADGIGLTWNAGEAPTEGYTNFLLVVLLAPCLRLGLDPLQITRALSVVAVLGSCLVLYRLQRLTYDSSRWVCALGASALLLSAATGPLCMIGLETAIYTFALLISFGLALRLLHDPSTLHAAHFGGALFVASLLRPEALLLAPILSASALVLAPDRVRVAQQLLVGLGASLLLPLGAYLGWKVTYYGDVLPNPFYLKVRTGGFLSDRGLQSILRFAEANWRLGVLAVCSLFLVRTHRPVVLFTTSLLVAYGLFFAGVDTLMDAHGRFLFPLVPILIILAHPAFRAVLVLPARLDVGVAARAALVSALILLLFFDPQHPRAVLGAARGVDRFEDPEDLMQKELQVARQLSRYERIGEVWLAVGDAGVIPYFTGASHLDLAGLNDRTIARGKDVERLIDYVFSRKPDLVFLSEARGRGWITFGHGPLGDYSRLAADLRWDEYRYAGTITSHVYDLHLFVRRGFHDAGGLFRFIRNEVVDLVHDPFPLEIGSYSPQGRGAGP